MRKLFGVCLLVTAILAPAILGSPASAATRRRVVGCRSSNTECWPAAFAFTPDGRRVFYAERYTGHIRVKNLRTGRHRLWRRIGNLSTSGEQGLLGLALDPRWNRAKRYRWVYAYYTRSSPLENRIVRLRKLNGRWRADLLARIPASGNHNGGVIGFGPGGKLFAVTGDAGSTANSQSTANLAGKVVRMTKMGRTPEDNPVINGTRTRIYSYGHRNSFGFAFDPWTNILWQTENGPNCDDEINRIRAGRNYGWGPGSSCPDTSEVGPSPQQPSLKINPVNAPTGAAFCSSCGVSGQGGRLLFGSWNHSRIYSVGFTSGRGAIDTASFAPVFDNPSGILGMRRVRSGTIYFSDMRGIYRLSN